MERGEPPVDLGRLSKPEADAFRYIAEALGARFEGDRARPSALAGAPAAAHGETHGEDGAAAGLPGAGMPLPRQGSAVDPALDDPVVGAVLDRIPVALVVVLHERLAFMNRTALSQFGYGSAAVVEAVGGFAALFEGGGKHDGGLVAMLTASGMRFLARVTMAVIDWAGAQAMLVSVMPAPLTGRAGHPVDADALQALLDANPDPVAIVSRAGLVEACNEAFRRLPGSGGAVMRLSDRLQEDDARHVVDLVDLSFGIAGGIAHSGRAVDVGGMSLVPTVGALRGGGLAFLVLHTGSGGWPDAAARPQPAAVRAPERHAPLSFETANAGPSAIAVLPRHDPGEEAGVPSVNDPAVPGAPAVEGAAPQAAAPPSAGSGDPGCAPSPDDGEGGERPFPPYPIVRPSPDARPPETAVGEGIPAGANEGRLQRAGAPREPEDADGGDPGGSVASDAAPATSDAAPAAADTPARRSGEADPAGDAAANPPAAPPVRVAGEATAGTLADAVVAPAATIREHPAGAERRAGRPRRATSALAEAVREVRQLVAAAGVLIVTDGDDVPDDGDSDAEAEFLRLLVLSVAARTPAGGVLVARREAGRYVVELSGDAKGPFEAVLSSERIAALARLAGASLHLAGQGRLVAERMPATLPDNVIRLDAERELAARSDRSA